MFESVVVERRFRILHEIRCFTNEGSSTYSRDEGQWEKILWEEDCGEGWSESLVKIRSHKYWWELYGRKEVCDDRKSTRNAKGRRIIRQEFVLELYKFSRSWTTSPIENWSTWTQRHDWPLPIQNFPFWNTHTWSTKMDKLRIDAFVNLDWPIYICASIFDSIRADTKWINLIWFFFIYSHVKRFERTIGKIVPNFWPNSVYECNEKPWKTRASDKNGDTIANNSFCPLVFSNKTR